MIKHFLLFLLFSLPLAAQPLVDPFAFVIPSNDSTTSQWLPSMPREIAGSHGFVRASAGGHLEFEDGVPVRFFGVGMQGSACFPDSATAVTMAAHLAKLGVNLVHFDYFDYHNSDGASTLAPGQRSDTLSASQMKRLDWFLHQLRMHGIYSHLVLKSRGGPRRDDGVPGWDSTYGNGQYITFHSEPFQRVQRTYLTKLLGHLNPYSGRRYADDPSIALMTIVDQLSPYSLWVGDYLNMRSGVLSYSHSRLLDTMFSDFLRRRHGSTAGVRAAYREGIAGTGPELLKNPGFELFTDNWELTVGEGALASSVIVSGPDVAEGANSLRLAIRRVNGTESRIILDQEGFPMVRNGIYRLSFKARTDTAAGRQLRVQLFRSSPYAALGADTTVTLTTAWQTYSVTFRSTVDDSLTTTIRFSAGKTLGDVLLDGVHLVATGREGLGAGESLEAFNIERAKFRDTPKIAWNRMIDLAAFYDSLARAYYGGMRSHLRSLGVRVPVAATNQTQSSADIWVQSELDFTSELATWDGNFARPGLPYSDSTWVIRNYSILDARDQKITEMARAAVVGKPFIAEGYGHAYPNAHRTEMMLYLPAYLSLQDWDGGYLYRYANSQTELGDRRRALKDDFWGIAGDPSVLALMPQASAIIRNHWIRPAEREIAIQHDTADLAALPITYYARGSFEIDGSFDNVSTMINRVRIGSFNAPRHYTASDYYVTIPENDRIESDTKEILRDVTKGVMTVNTSHAQGGSGRLGLLASMKTDNVSTSWIKGAAHTTWLWTSLDTTPLVRAGRSLLTISTRSLNTGALWQFGDSSIGKNWGTAPTMLESVTLGLNFTTDADTLRIHPLDSTGRPSGRVVEATRATGGTLRVTLDLSTEQTPWFGVEQIFARIDSTTGVRENYGIAARIAVGEASPNPATTTTMIPVELPAGEPILSARLYDPLGDLVLEIPAHRAVTGSLVIDVAGLAPGVHICVVRIGEGTFARKIVVAR
jgi:hypothetical protein